MGRGLTYESHAHVPLISMGKTWEFRKNENWLSKIDGTNHQRPEFTNKHYVHMVERDGFPEYHRTIGPQTQRTDG
jgi:hypothetical protein